MHHLAKLHIGQNVQCQSKWQKNHLEWAELKTITRTALKRAFEMCVWCVVSGQAWPSNWPITTSIMFHNGSFIGELAGLAFGGRRAQACSVETEIDRRTA